jgi:hypothetical protein
MNNFFKWWYTNNDGLEYMTVLGCSMNDMPVIVILGVLLVCVMLQYADVSWHNYSISRKYENSNTKRYLLYFTLVFVFCSIAGYGYRLLSNWVNPYKLLILILIILNTVTFYFRKYMKRTRAVENLFEAEKQIAYKFDKLIDELEKKVLESFSNKNAEMITYDELKQLEIGKKYPVNDKVFFIPIDLSGEVLHIITEVKPDGWFGAQVHDCYEMCETYRGELIRNKGVLKGIKQGEKTVFKPNEIHHPGSIKGWGGNVYFSKYPF